jgi:hypothetical protein
LSRWGFNLHNIITQLEVYKQRGWLEESIELVVTLRGFLVQIESDEEFVGQERDWKVVILQL